MIDPEMRSKQAYKEALLKRIDNEKEMIDQLEKNLEQTGDSLKAVGIQYIEIRKSGINDLEAELAKL